MAHETIHNAAQPVKTALEQKLAHLGFDGRSVLARLSVRPPQPVSAPERKDP